VKSPFKFLVIRFSSIGDIVLTTPVIRCLKQQVPGAEVHFATKKNYQALLENNPYLDKIFLLEDSLRMLLPQLQAENYDAVIDLHNNLRTRRLKMALGKKAYQFNKLNLQKWIYINFKIKSVMPPVHIVERYLKTVEPFGVKDDGLGLDYFIPEKDEISLSQLPVSHQSGFVVYAIGGQHFTKKLPMERMIELCRKIRQPVVLLGGKEDAENGEVIAEALGGKILNFCGKLSVNQSASVIKNSLCVYTHDTGMMHIAAAFHKKIISIWGNTTPLLGMYPYRTAFEVWENNTLSCRPCSKIGFDRCPKGHFKCMQEIRLDV
jgi:ADP-heptose:LPS heptosyltransferase